MKIGFLPSPIMQSRGIPHTLVCNALTYFTSTTGIVDSASVISVVKFVYSVHFWLTTRLTLIQLRIYQSRKTERDISAAVAQKNSSYSLGDRGLRWGTCRPARRTSPRHWSACCEGLLVEWVVPRTAGPPREPPDWRLTQKHEPCRYLHPKYNTGSSGEIQSLGACACVRACAKAIIITKSSFPANDWQVCLLEILTSGTISNHLERYIRQQWVVKINTFLDPLLTSKKKNTYVIWTGWHQQVWCRQQRGDGPPVSPRWPARLPSARSGRCHTGLPAVHPDCAETGSPSPSLLVDSSVGLSLSVCSNRFHEYIT